MNGKTTGPKGHKNVWGYLDETGSIKSPRGGPIFGLGLLVTPIPRALHKQITDLRSHVGYDGEFKFNEVRNKSLPVYKKLLDAYFETPNARFSCLINLRDEIVTSSSTIYRTYNSLSGKLICASLDKGNYRDSDYIAVIADDVSTVMDDNFELQIRKMIKTKMRRNALFGMSRAESHAFSELQLTDVLLGAVAYSFKLRRGLLVGPPAVAKQELVKHLQTHLDKDNIAESFVAKLKYGQRFEVISKISKR